MSRTVPLERGSAVSARVRVEEIPVAVPLLVLYLALATLYAWQASRHVTPTIFTDESEFAQISRAIADTGIPARRGVHYWSVTLYEFLAAPAWWIHETSTAYELIKTLGVLLMTSVLFPAYALARFVVSRPWALFAAAGAAFAPALAYAPFLVEEPVAYPVATLALWLIARAVARPSGRTVALALAGCALGVATRTQLAVLFAVLAGSMLVPVWRMSWFRRYRATWTAWDWASAAVIGAGVVVGLFAFLGHQSESWYVATAFEKQRMLDYGLWAFGALAIGLGILPLVAGLAALVRPRGEPVDDRSRGFLTVAVAAIACFGFYAAVKAAYVSTVFSTLVLERNLIYLVPVLFAATALALARGLRWPLVLPAGALALYLVATTPYKLETYPYYEAPGLSIAALANREWRWPTGRIEDVLSAVVVVACALLVAAALVRSRPALARGVTLVLAAAALAWPLTAQIYAADGFSTMTKQFLGHFPSPPDWVDRATHGGTVTYFGQQIKDPNGVLLTEFWNRSVKNVWSIDGSAGGLGPTLTPDLAKPTGVLTHPPGTDFLLADGGVAVAGKPVARGLQLYRLHGPIRLAHAQLGVFSDGWMSADAAYNQYLVRPGERGFVKITLSRLGWCGKNVPGHVTVRVGPLVIGPDKQAGLRTVTARRTATIDACKFVPLFIRVPAGPWRAEVHIDPTFVPADLDPGNSERRALGAQVAFSFVPIS